MKRAEEYGPHDIAPDGELVFRHHESCTTCMSLSCIECGRSLRGVNWVCQRQDYTWYERRCLECHLSGLVELREATT